MSGRSAWVRAKTAERADKQSSSSQYPEYGFDSFIYGLDGLPAVQNAMQTSQSYVGMQSPPLGRRHSLSSAKNIYAYPSPPARKPRPIIIASAIEKSDFRIHFDGMSKSVRGKIGKLIKRGSENPEPRIRQPTGSGSSESGSRSTVFASSLTIVPSPTPATPPLDGLGTFLYSPSVSSQQSHRARPYEGSTQGIRRFEGGGKLPKLEWRSMANNPELWDSNGDTLIYMYTRGSRTKPPPSFRVSSTVIYESGSTTFIGQLRDTSVPKGWPRFCPSDLPSPVTSRSNTGSSALSSAVSGFPPYPLSHSAADSGIEDMDYILPIEMTSRLKEFDGIRHEIYVAWPGHESGVHCATWHITTRNFFAVMYNAKALVGTTLYGALARLFERINTYPDYLGRHINKASWITDYIMRHEFDDVRNNPSFAASLLAFSETPGVQWREGYIESFVHCVGMLNIGLQTIPEWKFITPHTRMFLQNASLELEERIHRAQKWLFSFDFAVMWPMSSAPSCSAKGCFDRFRKWLCKYYEGVFPQWPPANDTTWLTREMIVRLRNDFYGLYDYLVDREVIFDGSEYRQGQKWVIISKAGQTVRVDTPELPFTDIILGFDDRHSFPHMPYPFPRTPTSVAVVTKHKTSFTLKKPATAVETLAQSRRKALSYSEASNVYILRDHYVHMDLVQDFIKFEQTDLIDHLDPFEARRGRWLLIYGILQVLATVAADSPNIRYVEGVQYHVGPQMKGAVPWAEVGSPPEEEAEHTRSHCWTVPQTWANTAPKARPGAHKPIIWGPYGDGRTRVDSLEKISSASGRIKEINMGKKRAQEWVANTAVAAADPAELHSESIKSVGGAGGGMGIVSGSSPRVGTSSGVTAGTEREVVSSGGSSEFNSNVISGESAAQAARRRRAAVHGFTDFQVPEDW
ncbi:MAG: hypothetical protein MMC33_000480 [Icmadophila ericetorum]|nr:hypothetical protein [Icmadophila ericetorum]